MSKSVSKSFTKYEKDCFIRASNGSVAIVERQSCVETQVLYICNKNILNNQLKVI